MSSAEWMKELSPTLHWAPAHADHRCQAGTTRARAGDLHAEAALQYMRREINGIGDDATWLRRIEDENHLLPRW